MSPPTEVPKNVVSYKMGASIKMKDERYAQLRRKKKHFPESQRK